MKENPLTFHIITVFPEFYESPLSVGLFRKAQEKGIINFRFIDLKKFGVGKHKEIDGKPYGGGTGMILRAEPLVSAIRSVEPQGEKKTFVLMTPSGELLSQKKAKLFLSFSDIVLVCPRYEGVDERVKKYIDWEISIGDYVIHSGDTACLVFVETVSRLIPGFMSSDVEEEITFGLLGFPHYSQPRDFEGEKVPDVLLSGHHEKIRRWRIEMSVRKTLERRPDLILKILMCIQDIPQHFFDFLFDELKNLWCSEIKGREGRRERIFSGRKREEVQNEIFTFLVDYFLSRNFDIDPFLKLP